MMIHLEAKKLGLKGLPKESIPNFWKLLFKKGYLFLPIVTLITFMSMGRTPAYSAIYAILTAVIVSMFSKDTRLTPKTFTEALANGAKNTMGVAIACAIAGIIVGIVTLTGLGQDLLNVLMGVAGTSKLLALFLTMISCIILGMGVPTTANYVIMATITAPIVMSMGVPMLAAHMFVFYFGIVADITPPGALAAYAGSAIAKSNPFKTGVTATRLAITAFIVPYIFAFNPAMLLIDTTAPEVVRIVLTSLIGIFGVSVAMEGFMMTEMRAFERIIIGGAGLMLIDPNLLTDTTGILVIFTMVYLQWAKSKKLKISLEQAV
jgi:TRAP transporter 4TM/12TM fusion protein